MIKVILGTQMTPDSILTQRDFALVTSDEEVDALKAVIRILDNNSNLLSNPLMVQKLTPGDLDTVSQMRSLELYLQESRLAMPIAEIIQEVGDEENSSLSVLVINTNASSVIKPGVIYHTTPYDLDMLKIYEDTVNRYNILPESIFGNSLFRKTLLSAKDMKKLAGFTDNVSLVQLHSMFKSLGFKTYIIAR